MKTIYLHIGYPKTATTTLQKHIFPYLHGLKYFHKEFGNKSLDTIIEELLSKKITDLDISSYRDVIDKELSSTNLISAENIIFRSFLPYKTNNGITFQNQTIIADKLKKVFDPLKFDVKILIVLRKQISIISSIYAQSYTDFYSNFDEYNKFKKYVQFFSTDQLKKHPLNELITYNEVVLYYNKLFGKNNVHVLLYEEMLNDKDLFLMNLMDTINISSYHFNTAIQQENVRSTDYGYKKVNELTLRILLKNLKNKYFPNINYKLSKHQKNFLDFFILSQNAKINKTLILSNEDKLKISNNYNNSNKLLFSLFDDRAFKKGLEYGYFT
jgi:hypothetical protein